MRYIHIYITLDFFPFFFSFGPPSASSSLGRASATCSALSSSNQRSFRYLKYKTNPLDLAGIKIIYKQKAYLGLICASPGLCVNSAILLTKVKRRSIQREPIIFSKRKNIAIMWPFLWPSLKLNNVNLPQSILFCRIMKGNSFQEMFVKSQKKAVYTAYR